MLIAAALICAVVVLGALVLPDGGGRHTATYLATRQPDPSSPDTDVIPAGRF